MPKALTSEFEAEFAAFSVFLDEFADFKVFFVDEEVVTL